MEPTPPIGDILRAIREVEANLDRRIERVQGALMIMWGVLVAVIAGFYQLVVLDPGPFVRALGVVGVNWVWLALVAAGYATSVVAGARTARLTDDPRVRRAALRDFVPAVVSAAIAAGLVIAGRHDLIGGALLVGFAATTWLRARRSAVRTAALVVAAVCAVAGVALLVRPVGWSWAACGVLFGGGLILLGRLRMARATG